MATISKSDQLSIIPSDISPFSLDDLYAHISRILNLPADHQLPHHDKLDRYASDFDRNSKIKNESEVVRLKINKYSI